MVSKQAKEITPTTKGGPFHSTRRYGNTHGDTVRFDTAKILSEKWPGVDPLAIHLTKIKYHYGYLVPGGVLNGLQFTFRNCNTNEEYTTADFYGDHQYGGNKTYTLSPGEFICDAVVHPGEIMDGIFLKTTRENQLNMGGKGGNRTVVEFQCPKPVVIGFFGGYGGHIHNIGFHYASLKDVVFHRRRLYLLLAQRLKSNSDVAEQLRESIKKDAKLKGKGAEYAFLILSIDMSKVIFARTLQYIC